MLYLAQVQNHPTSGNKELYLLAYQLPDMPWQIQDPEKLACELTEEFQVGNLVLVELSESQEILKLDNAKDWVLEMIQNCLSYPFLTPEWVEKEQARIEQGRQEITAKSLDLTRRQLELETQREQLQALENQLKKNKDH